MAFTLAVSTCLDSCATIKFYDSTGLGTDGWEGSNPSRVDATSASLVITYTNSSGTTEEITVDVLSELQAGDFSEVLLTTQEELGDGYYEVEYSVIVDDTLYTASTEFTITCDVDCCVDKLAAKVAKDICAKCPSDTNFKIFTLAEGFLSALNRIAACSGKEEFLSVLAQLEKICGTSGCGCGCS